MQLNCASDLTPRLRLLRLLCRVPAAPKRNRKKTFCILQRSALFKDDPVPRQGPTMATIDGRGKYKIPQNIFTPTLTLKIFSLILQY